MNKYVVFTAVLAVLNSAIAQNISGKIIHSETKRPIANCSILFLDLETKIESDSLGTFSFGPVRQSVLHVKFSASGFEELLSELQVQENLLIELNAIHIHDQQTMNEVVVSSLSLDRKKMAISPETSKKLQELKLIPLTSIGDVISSIPGVYNASNGPGISKPVIRGLQGMRVVTYLNGLRIENQQWGGDHGMGVTDLGIEQITVVKGPSALQYGSDALGGVIVMKDENFAAVNNFETGASSQFESNTLGINSRFYYKTSSQKLRFSAAAMHTNHADYALGNGKFAGNSRFSDIQGKLNLAYSSSKFITQLRYSINSSRIGIPGHTHDSIIDYSEFQYNSQKRSQTIPAQLLINHFLQSESKLLFKNSDLSISLGLTSNGLTELEDKITIPGIQVNLTNYLSHVKYSWKINSRFKFISGVQQMTQHVLNSTEATEQLLPNGKVNDLGAYSFLLSEFEKWVLQGGIRFDTRSIQRDNDANTKSFNQLNYAFGIARTTKKHTFRSTLSSGFRTPHFSELYSDGVHHGTFRYEIGTTSLKQEKAQQLDVNYEFTSEHIGFSINPFASLIHDFISIQPLDSLIEGLPVFQYQQLTQVKSAGMDFSVHYHPHFVHALHLEANYSFIHMEDQLGNSVSLTPPRRINSFMRYQFKARKSWYLDYAILQYQYVFKQNRVATLESPTSGYHLTHLAIRVKHAKYKAFEIDLGVRNVFNVSYIEHLSRMKNINLPAPGRNFIVSVKWNMQKSNN